jgi:DNA-binding transcriptional MerR regulator
LSAVADLRARIVEKAPDAFRTISEVAEDLDLPQHVLRFWETRFSHIKPLKRGGGRRYYRPDDIDLLKGIRYYLYGEGYTIKGVQRILKERGIKHVIEMGRAVTENYAPPVAVIPKADEEERRRARASEWPEAEAVRSRLEPAFGARELDQPENLAVMAGDAGDVVELEPPVQAQSAPRAAPAPILPAALSPSPSLTRDDLRRLQSTLFELMECKRILDSVR